MMISPRMTSLLQSPPTDARRRPSRLNISKVKCIKLRPKNVAFGAQRTARQLLFGKGMRVTDHPLQRELRIRRGLG